MALNVGYVARETTQNLGRNLTLTFASIITVAVSLTLAGVGLLIGQGVDNLAGNFRGDVELIIFLEPDIAEDQRLAVGERLEANPEVAGFTYVDQAEAFEEAQRLFEDQPATASVLRESDVPPSFRVQPTNPDVESVVALRATFERQPGVRSVESATEAIRAIQELTEKLNLGIRVASSILAIIAVLLIYNTLRTAMFARRREIEVMKLVGATNWFIRVPFILEGLIQAILGGLVAAGLMFGLDVALFGSLSDGDYFRIFDSFDFETSTVVWTSLQVSVIGVIIGAVGSGFAVGRFLDV